MARKSTTEDPPSEENITSSKSENILFEQPVESNQENSTNNISGNSEDAEWEAPKTEAPKTRNHRKTNPEKSNNSRVVTEVSAVNPQAQKRIGKKAIRDFEQVSENAKNANLIGFSSEKRRVEPVRDDGLVEGSEQNIEDAQKEDLEQGSETPSLAFKQETPYEGEEEIPNPPRVRGNHFSINYRQRLADLERDNLLLRKQIVNEQRKREQSRLDDRRRLRDWKRREQSHLQQTFERDNAILQRSQRRLAEQIANFESRIAQFETSHGRESVRARSRARTTEHNPQGGDRDDDRDHHSGGGTLERNDNRSGSPERERPTRGQGGGA